MNSPRTTSLLLLLLDALAVGLLFNVIGWLRGVVHPNEWTILPLLVPLAMLVLGLYLIDGYRARTDMLSLDYASEHVITLLITMLGVVVLTFVIIPAGYTLQNSRAVVGFSFLVLIPVTLSYRRWFYLASQRQRKHQSIVFISNQESRRDFAAECDKLNFSRPVIYTDFGAIGTPAADDPAHLPFTEVLAQIDRGEIRIEAIVLCESGQDSPPDIARRLTRLYFSGVPTYTLELFHQLYWRKIPLYRLNQTWLFQEGFKIARDPVHERIKRISDIMLASTVLLLSAPFLLLAVVAIRLEDLHPAIFRQTRIGKNHVPFIIYKLRTMRHGNSAGENYTRLNDDRITRVGRFLRLTRFDEFPQLWNVLRGDMSLIGPRAEWDVLVDNYERQIPCYYFRHLVKPGITGWAQVNYPYGASLEDTLRKLEYDLYYIRHFSLLLDAAIVLKTIHVMLFGKGR